MRAALRLPCFRRAGAPGTPPRLVITCDPARVAVWVRPPLDTVMLEPKTKSATVWILGADEKTLTPVKTDKLRLVVSNTNPKIEIDLLPTDKADDGTASVFVGKHDGFGVEMEYQGTVTVTIDGKPYSADFKEEPEKKK